MYNEIYDLIYGIANDAPPIAAIIAAAVLIVFAFFSYRLLNVFIAIIGGLGGFFAGFVISINIFNIYIVSMIVGFVFAILFGIVAIKFRQYYVFLLTSLAIYAHVYSEMSYMDYSNYYFAIDADASAIIASVIIAALFGVIIVKLFRPLYIISSSVACSCSAVYLLADSLLGKWINDDIVLIVCWVIVAVISILATIRQFQTTIGEKFDPDDK